MGGSVSAPQMKFPWETSDGWGKLIGNGFVDDKNKILIKESVNIVDKTPEGPIKRYGKKFWEVIKKAAVTSGKTVAKSGKFAGEFAFSLFFDWGNTTLNKGSVPDRSDVFLYHGSIDDYNNIQKNGLDPDRGTAFVTRDLFAAKNAISSDRYDVAMGRAKDPGIIMSKISRKNFNIYFLPYERMYSGFNSSLLPTTEIPLRSAQQMEIFNRGIIK